MSIMGAQTTGVAVIGAGPYGLSVAAHLRARGVPYRIFGRPMDSWRQHMPDGMALKSRPFASNLSDPGEEGTLGKYCSAIGMPIDPVGSPVSLELFGAYGLDFQRRFVPDLDERFVVSLDRTGNRFELKLKGGDTVEAHSVVTAIGISHFAEMPAVLGALPEKLSTHSYEHSDLSRFSGRVVAVIGAGSSAVDIATLLAESGATTSLISRGGAPKFYSVSPPESPGVVQRALHPRAALGDWLPFWLYEKRPGLFRYLPAALRLALIERVLGPASPSSVLSRFQAGVDIRTNQTIIEASEEQGRVRLVLQTHDGTMREMLVDHVIGATGYRPRVSSISFLSDDLRSSIRTYAQRPVLSAHFESSVPGLFFVGLLAAGSFGPLMRFVAGAGYAAGRVSADLARRIAQPRSLQSPQMAGAPEIVGPSRR